MAEKMISVGDGFWNIRGVFRLSGLLNIGTQASLVRQNDGSFVLLDSYTLPDPILRQVYELTNQGKDVDAIINVHPFHTIHVRRAHEQFPNARLFGSERHVRREPDLTWQTLRVDDPRMNEAFPELDFSVPAGVDFISANESVHFSSVLVRHRPSQTLHVDDTFNFIRLPLIGGLSFHPTLSRALQKRPGAAQEFRQWATKLAKEWSALRHVCAAHTTTMMENQNSGPSIAERMRTALSNVEPTLKKHERNHG